MRRKNRLLFGFTLFFITLSFPKSTYTQSINNYDQGVDLLIVRSIKTHFTYTDKDINLKIISLDKIIEPLIIDFKYATLDNFTKQKLYHKPHAFLRYPAAEALKNVQADLLKLGLSIKIFDAYRPYRVTQKMWEIIPDERYAANPARGSGHNRGIAVDVTLVNVKTGKEIEMPTPFDDFSEKAHHNYNHLSKEIIANRALLKTTMEKNGFLSLDTEWWHYFLPNSKKYPLMDLSFRQMKKAAKHDLKYD